METTTTRVARCCGCGHFVAEVIEGERAKFRVRCSDSKCRSMLLIEFSGERITVTRLPKDHAA